MNFINRLPENYDPETVLASREIFQEVSTTGLILRFKNSIEELNQYSRIAYPDSVIEIYRDKIIADNPKTAILFDWKNCRQCDRRKKLSLIRKILIEDK